MLIRRLDAIALRAMNNPQAQQISITDDAGIDALFDRIGQRAEEVFGK